MNWIKQILTGSNNDTIAIGRAMGMAVFVLFIVALPVIAILTVRSGSVQASEWQAILASMQVYVPAILLAIAGLIGLTAPSEPKE